MLWVEEAEGLGGLGGSGNPDLSFSSGYQYTYKLQKVWELMLQGPFQYNVPKAIASEATRPGVSFSGEAKNSSVGLGPGMGPNVLEAMAVEAKESMGEAVSGMEPCVLEDEGVSTGRGPWMASARLWIEGF